jgi:hypothetical protein
LPVAIELRDVADVEGFVNATINTEFKGRRRLDLTRQEREELLAEGTAIMLELDAVYEPRRAGHTKDGRFSGFAAFYLPKRLADAWHRQHEEHRYVTDPETGKRRYVYLKPALSLDQLTAEHSDSSSDGQGGHGSKPVESRVLTTSKWAPIAHA